MYLEGHRKKKDRISKECKECKIVMNLLPCMVSTRNFCSVSCSSKHHIRLNGHPLGMLGKTPWNKGKKGFVPWNKGLNKYSDSRVKHYSEKIGIHRKNKTYFMQYGNRSLDIRKKIASSHKKHMLKGISLEERYGKDTAISMKESIRKKMKLYHKNVNMGIEGSLGFFEKEILDNFEVVFESKILRQYRCGKYRIDGYLPLYNLAIEIDDRKHFNIDGSLRDYDIKRESDIKNELRCSFLRIPTSQTLFNHSLEIVNKNDRCVKI